MSLTLYLTHMGRKLFIISFMMAWSLQILGQAPSMSFTLPSFYKFKTDSSDTFTECVNASNKVFWFHNKPEVYFEDSCMLCRDVNRGKLLWNICVLKIADG